MSCQCSLVRRRRNDLKKLLRTIAAVLIIWASLTMWLLAGVVANIVSASMASLIVPFIYLIGILFWLSMAQQHRPKVAPRSISLPDLCGIIFFVVSGSWGFYSYFKGGFTSPWAWVTTAVMMSALAWFGWDFVLRIPGRAEKFRVDYLSVNATPEAIRLQFEWVRHRRRCLGRPKNDEDLRARRAAARRRSDRTTGTLSHFLYARLNGLVSAYEDRSLMIALFTGTAGLAPNFLADLEPGLGAASLLIAPFILVPFIHAMRQGSRRSAAAVRAVD